MLQELVDLVLAVPESKNKEQFKNAIIIDNCLGKRSEKSRKLTSEHLVELYSLDPSVPIFRNLLFFWKRDKEAQPLIALLCASCRDSILRKSFRIIFSLPENSILSRETTEKFIDSLVQNRFSAASLKSMAQNINSSWTHSGHLNGKAKKIRTKAIATPAAISYALYLGYLEGARGPELFLTDFVKITDCSKERAIEMAEIAAQRGWINFKRIGNVMEITFPMLITAEEAQWLNE